MKIGFATSDITDTDFITQYYSLLSEGLQPDFVLVHNGGLFLKTIKVAAKLYGVFKTHRFESFAYLRRKAIKSATVKTTFLGLNDLQLVEQHLKSVTIIYCPTINHRWTIKHIHKLGPSIIICHSGILKSKVLSSPETIFLNVHSSKLPEYRGMNNIEWALFENNEIFCTIHKISRGIDEGDILFQDKITYDKSKITSLIEFRNYCFFKSNLMLGKALRLYFERKIDFIPQPDKGTSLMQYYTMHPILKARLLEKYKINER